MKELCAAEGKMRTTISGRLGTIERGFCSIDTRTRANAKGYDTVVPELESSYVGGDPAFGKGGADMFRGDYSPECLKEGSSKVINNPKGRGDSGGSTR